jgi:predicted alpha/beta hydrolase
LAELLLHTSATHTRTRTHAVHACTRAGFDVWLPNTRGNTFSRGNYKYDYRQNEYWYHSFDQYALIDSPAMINTALKVAGAKKLAFVGHSQVRCRRVEMGARSKGRVAPACGAATARLCMQRHAPHLGAQPTRPARARTPPGQHHRVCHAGGAARDE